MRKLVTLERQYRHFICGSEVMYYTEPSKYMQLLLMCCPVCYYITYDNMEAVRQIYLAFGLMVTNGLLDLGM
jgi:hypothetical protein